jgi:hypothetical protein
MKSFIFAAVSLAALGFGYAQAQDMPSMENSSSQSAGGVPDTARSDAGAAMGKTRSQVYQELVNARQSGEFYRTHEFRGR